MRRFINPLLLWLAHSSRADLIRQIQYLKVENQVLRARLPKVIYTTPQERHLLLRYARPVGRTIYQLISIVSYATMRRWLLNETRCGWRPSQPPGRPRTSEFNEELVLKIARETGWGYTRILGELKKLDVTTVSRSTVVNILKRHGFDPSPHRKKATWDQFIKRHASSLWACDFMTRRVPTWRGWKYAWVLVCVNVQTRKAWISPSAYRPGGAWTARQAELFMDQVGDHVAEPPVLMHDHDTRFSWKFRQALEARGGIAHRLPLRAPNLNAYVERFIQTVQHECLDHFVCFGTRHLDHLLTEYLEHYHQERPHQSLGNVPLAVGPPLRMASPPDATIHCRSRLGGLLRHYERCAA